MKKLLSLFTVCAATGCLLLTGCSKGENAKSSSGTSSANSKPVDLKINWVVGKKYVMQMKMSQGSEMTLPGLPKPMNQSLDMTQTFDMSVLKAMPDGGRQLQLKFEAVKMSITRGGHRLMSFDSSLPAAEDSTNSAALMLRKLVGAHIQYVINATGKVENVEGWKELNERITNGVPPQEQAGLGRMFSKETLKQYGSFDTMMPGHPVKVGDSWQVNREIPSAIGVLTIDLKNTFQEWEQHAGRRCARIEYKGDISSSGKSTLPNATIKLEKGQISGNSWFDPELGMMTDTDSYQKFTMSVTARGKPITMLMIQKVHFTLVKTEDLAKD